MTLILYRKVEICFSDSECIFDSGNPVKVVRATLELQQIKQEIDRRLQVYQGFEVNVDLHSTYDGVRRVSGLRRDPAVSAEDPTHPTENRLRPFRKSSVRVTCYSK